MYYLKNGKKKIFIEDDNVFTQCPRCGKEQQIDLADAVIDLELLEKIKATLDEIQGLREDLDDLLDNSGVTLENLERMRDTLSEIQGLREDLDE